MSIASGDGVYQVGVIIINTYICSAVGGLMSVFIQVTGCLGNNRHLSIIHSVNCILGSLVAITGPCLAITPWASVITAILATICYDLSSRLIFYLKIDDPLDVFSVHGACGVLGLLIPGFFADNGMCMSMSMSMYMYVNVNVNVYVCQCQCQCK